MFFNKILTITAVTGTIIGMIPSAYAMDPEDKGAGNLRNNNRAEAVRLFMTENTPESQKKMRGLVRYSRQGNTEEKPPLAYNPLAYSQIEKKGSFHAMVNNCLHIFEQLLPIHQLKSGLLKENNFKESEFAIPALATSYQALAKIEAEQIALLSKLGKTKPGFMINIIYPVDYYLDKEEPSFESEMLANTKDPFLCLSKGGRMKNMMTFGESNVAIDMALGEKLNHTKIFQAFQEAKSLLDDLHRPRVTLYELALTKLDFKRGDSDGFKKQKEKVAQYNTFMQETAGEIELLEKGKLMLEDLIYGEGVKVRNFEFMEEHPYLRP